MLRTFASDNNAPVAPEILHAIEQANQGDTVSYGDDEYTRRACQALRRVFGQEADPYFAVHGTGANVVALSCLLKPDEAVMAPSSAHLRPDECGAFERFTGCKILPIDTQDGKIRIEDLR